MKSTSFRWMVSTLLLSMPVCPVMAAEAMPVRVAVTEDFSDTLEELVAQFRQEQDADIEIVPAEADALFEDILDHSSSYDIFLAADDQHVQSLEQKGLASSKNSFTYAVGKLVLWMPGQDVLNMEALTGRGVEHIAVLDPAASQYGVAAEQAIQTAGLNLDLAEKVVYASSVAEAMDMVESGDAQAAFIPAAHMSGKSPAELWQVPDDMYQPIAQRAVLLTNGEKNDGATRFFNYLHSDEAKSTIAEAGYELASQ